MQQKKLILNSIKSNDNLLIYFYILLLSLSAIFLTIHYGFKGVFPIDSFLIYDAGYKIFNGFVPFKDYWSITGPLLDYIQFAIFKLFGVNWFSYVFHSAGVNLISTIIFFYFFISLGLKKIYSFIYALSFSILAYPSVGTPFMDHHAALLSFISLIFFILGIKKDNGKFFFFVPIFLSLSFFSKQIPSAYLSILFIFFFTFYLKIKEFKNINLLVYIFTGALTSVVFFLFFLIINNISFKSFLIQYVFYPIEIGSERNLNIKFNFKNFVFDFKFIYFSLIPLVSIIFLLFKRSKKTIERKKDLLIIFLIIFSILIFIYSQILTKNQILIFFLVPFCIAISDFYTNKYYKINFIKYFLIFLLIISSLKFHLRFNENKKFMELNNINLDLAIDAEFLDKSTSGLMWISPDYPNNPKLELENLLFIKKKISSNKSNLIVITDYQILPSILNLKTVAPNKWFDLLSVPKKDSKYFNDYKNFFINSLKKQKIKTIYIIGDKEIYLRNIFQDNCYNKLLLNENLTRLEIQSCL